MNSLELTIPHCAGRSDICRTFFVSDSRAEARRMQTPALSATGALLAALTDVATEIPVLNSAERASVLRPAVHAAVDELRGMGLSSARVECVLLELVAHAWPITAGFVAVGDIRAWSIQRYYAPLR